MAKPLVQPQGLGEVVLRVRDMARAVSFYRDVLGLEVLHNLDDRIVFLKIDDGLEGHARIIGLFLADLPSPRGDAQWRQPESNAPTLHHFALEIPLSAYARTLEALSKAGHDPKTQDHRWIGWRSIYIADPDGNIVELVAVDPSLLD